MVEALQAQSLSIATRKFDFTGFLRSHRENKRAIPKRRSVVKRGNVSDSLPEVEHGESKCQARSTIKKSAKCGNDGKDSVESVADDYITIEQAERMILELITGDAKAYPIHRSTSKILISTDS
eukprot:802158-Amorphochlora_amoeboformis.AAC.1